MLEQTNQTLMHLLSAPADLSGGGLFLAIMVADWAILLGPSTLVLLWVLGRTDERRAAVGALLSALLALSVSGLVSAQIFHPRPFMDGLTRNYLHHAIDSSFPSDHSAVLFGLAFSMLLSRPTSVRRLWIAGLVLACAVGWSRVFLGAHYPFDIVGGALLGLLAAFVIVSRPGRYVRDHLTSFGEAIYSLPFRLPGARKD